ncbi:hypothetical protein CP985_07610 [Malaciobacter mytili LMG 24559]|uniref:histidine kinase n=1 Tax=Malaciobacter mytili LMG 24559 TaxID=1032238 RepID=A0AAX2AF48_9BACT|nr:ATP-binding protein [Malaciobacter mytili]AXH15107.1 two-component system sensor histidine kinase [Malaciobacter mytili LMG 24559]RXK15617.1 hypothetical protein CP985_07610 [Malaciobacter mytili LMG 24559]
MKKILIVFLFFSSVLFAKNILILNSYHPSFSWTKRQVDAIINTLSLNKNIDIYIEYMDTKRNNPDITYKYKFLTLLKYKYANKKIDLVISTDDNAINFLKDFRNEIFTDSKIVFSGVNNLKVLSDYKKSDITGVYERMTPLINYKVAKKINPNLEKLYLIGDDSVTFEVLKNLVISEFKTLDIPYEFISDKNIDVVTKKLSAKNDNSMAMLIMTARYVDSSNNIIVMEEAIQRISNAYKNPIISTAKVFNKGGKIIGGYVVDGQKQGTLAAKLALEVLEGKQPFTILSGTNSYVFDYDALNYFGIDISKYKFDSKVEIANKPLSFYEYYKQTLIILFIIVLSFLIIFIISIIYNFRLKKVNKRLEKSNKNIQLFIDSILEGVIISKNGFCVDVNKEAIKLLGYKTKKELIGKKLKEFIPASHHDFFTKNKPEESLFIKEDKSEIEVLAMTKDITLEEGIVKVLSFVDLSESKKREKVLFQQSKLASMGEMIGNIAHQWRQPLSAISTASSGLLLQRELNILDDELLHNSLKAILKSTTYLSNTIDDFKNYIKGDKDIQSFKISVAIENTLDLLGATLKNHRINVVKNFEDVEISSCQNEIIQVLINILNNSKDAINQNCKEDKLILIAIKEEQDRVIIDITDNGGGISNNIIDKIFEPYFTTKNKSQGTGLGLYMSYSLITESLGGTIFAQNRTFIYNNKEYMGVNMLITLPKTIKKD